LRRLVPDGKGISPVPNGRAKPCSRYTGWVPISFIPKTAGDAAGMQTRKNQPNCGEIGAGNSARILAVDYGRARMGLAIAETSAGVPRPLGVLVRINRNEDMRRLRELAREHAVKQIVVGLPLRLDGTRGEMAEEAERFAQRVRKQIGVPVEMVDERLTSWEAERLLEEQTGRVRREIIEHGEKRGRKKEVARQSVDAMAAAVILREYLEGLQAKKEKRGAEA
jgi:putative Holliday junction resolvase